MSGVLVCDGCDAEVKLGCAGLTKVPDGDEPWRCAQCVGEEPRASRAAPRRGDVDARVAQLGARCLRCGAPGAAGRELFFCEVSGCYGAWHATCAERKPGAEPRVGRADTSPMRIAAPRLPC